MGHHSFQALVCAYPSDALLCDNHYHAGLSDHIRGRYFSACGIAARFRVRCRSPGIMVAYGDTCSDCRVHITQVVEGKKLNTALSVPKTSSLCIFRSLEPSV